jgi:predicted alpha/beta-hydrolase family hydrolase
MKYRRRRRTEHPRSRVGERTVQFTVRQVPVQVEKALKRKAAIAGKSLNGVLLEALAHEAGVEREVIFGDLDLLAGRWEEDPAFDDAIRAQQQIDADLWK